MFLYVLRGGDRWGGGRKEKVRVKYWSGAER